MHTSITADAFAAKDRSMNIEAVIDHALACSEFALEQSEDGWISGKFYNHHLSSVFQPIFSSIRGKITGHAAYTCADSDGNKVLSPWHIFAMAFKDAQLVNLDHLSRVVHVLNYFNKAARLDQLFVGVQLRLLESVKDDNGRAFKNFLNLIGINASRVVVEIPAEVNRSGKLLQRVITNYRLHGYLISVNYSSSDDDRVLALGSLYPDIVRIEACDLVRHNRVFDRLTDTVHRFGAAFLVQEIETTEQLTTAIHAGADYLQGSFLGKATRGIEW